MAITRSQQAKQMLQDGGRIGLFEGALADTKKGKPMSPGTSVGGNTRGGTGKGRDLDVQQRGSTKEQYNRMVAEGTQGSYN